MAVAFLPFPTRLVAEAIHDNSAERAAAIFYGVWLLVIQLLLGALWGSIARDRDLLKPEVSEKEVNAILIATTPNLGFYIGVIVLAIFAPEGGRVRLPADRYRRPRASPWRPDTTTHDIVCVTLHGSPSPDSSGPISASIRPDTTAARIGRGVCATICLHVFEREGRADARPSLECFRALRET